MYTRQFRESRGEFTSCDSQYKVCFVFAASMPREGWQLVERCYNDLGHFSETLDRPALNRLVEDIQAGNIDRVLLQLLAQWLSLRVFVHTDFQFRCQHRLNVERFDVGINNFRLVLLPQVGLTG